MIAIVITSIVILLALIVFFSKFNVPSMLISLIVIMAGITTIPFLIVMEIEQRNKPNTEATIVDKKSNLFKIINGKILYGYETNNGVQYTEKQLIKGDTITKNNQ